MNLPEMDSINGADIRNPLFYIGETAATQQEIIDSG